MRPGGRVTVKKVAVGLLAQALFREGVLSSEQLQLAGRVQEKLRAPKPVPQLLAELFGTAADQIRAALRSQPPAVLGEILVELGHLRAEDYQSAQDLRAENPKRSIAEVLVEHRFLEADVVIDVLSAQLGIPSAERLLANVSAESLERFPREFLREHAFVPVRREGDTLRVAFADPTDISARAAAEQVFGKGRVRPALATRGAILATIERGEGREERASAGVRGEAAVALVDDLLRSAADRGASDIHIEPFEHRVRVRLREDGVMVPLREFSADQLPGVLGRIKVLCGADITEHRRHQGGRFQFSEDTHRLDLRVSFYVTVHGEKCVIRLLNHDRQLVPLDQLGMAPRLLERFSDEALVRPSGVVLVTGPTGSGKTTTLYSCVQAIRSDDVSIITAEDPVEYVIDGIAQCSINPSIDLTYEETLRHIVRQDPDVVVIGEIRDSFSASTAIQAALTGHKVLTTFHTEDTIGGLIRLLNMDIEAFLVSSTVVSVLAQRLLRRVCPECAEPTDPTPSELRQLGAAPEGLRGANFVRGTGCEACRFLGFKGRVAVFELLVLDEPVRDAVLNRASSFEIRRICRESSGLVSLLEDGLLKASEGLTTVEEVIRMLPRLEKPRSLGELRRRCGVH